MTCEDCAPLKSKVIRLLAYLSSFLIMCKDCCHPKRHCECGVKDETPTK
jgi:hypothetical protein